MSPNPEVEVGVNEDVADEAAVPLRTSAVVGSVLIRTRASELEGDEENTRSHEYVTESIKIQLKTSTPVCGASAKTSTV